MNTKSATWIPWLICATVIAVVCGVQILSRVWPQFDFFQRLEWMTYDWRVRLAARGTPPTTTNLGFVAISDNSLEAVRDGMYGNLPYRFGLYWPRQVYGRLVNELSVQGAKAVGFDVLFAELRPDHPPAPLPEGGAVGSDVFFAAEIHRAGNVILAADKGLPPHDLFRTNALALADISAHRESDGILRRAHAYEDVPLWHPLIKHAGRLLGWDLRRARMEPARIIFPTSGGGERTLPLSADQQFNQAKLYEELSGQPPPDDAPAWSQAFTSVRCWHMGIVLAARALKLDLDRARIEPAKGRIVLSGEGGLTRTIPIDTDRRFYIDWSMTPYDSALTKENIEWLLLQNEQRRAGQTAELTNRWRGKLVVVGSIATGNDLTDLGATPLEKETYLLSQQWNVANSVLTGRFVRQPALAMEVALIVVLGVVAGFLTWNLRVLVANACVLGSAALYVAAAVVCYVQWRWWLPMALPVGGALLILHASLVTYQVVHEQKERRRVKGVFDKIVSPNVVNELLEARQLSLGGVRREVTVMFADIRGFTRMTDASQARAEEYATQHQLSGEAARQHYERQAREVLDTVNLYLGLIANTVKSFDGTLDKYIGDCVMAFWGAPTPNEQHARGCVRAMMEAQRTIQMLNDERAAENRCREAANAQRADRGEEPLAMLPLLAVGIGINTGMATVGLIGSEAHILNYTVFGREVNVASRLEQIAGPGHTLIAEATRLALLRDDPALAAACQELPPVTLKGLQAPVKNYEVSWTSAPLT